MIRKKKSKSLNDTSSLDGNHCRLMKVMKIQEPSPPNETSKINKIRMTTVLPGKYCVPFTSSVTSSSCYSSLVMMFLTTVFLSGVTSSVNPLPSSPPTVTVNENNNKFFNHHHEVFDKQSSPNITSIFSTTNPAINFTHLTIDPETGRVFVGATNYLYQLNSNLSLEFAVKTGPVEDSPNCSPSDCQEVDSSLIRVTKNTNKILVIDPSSRMLIVCGSVHQGSCRRHSVSDIRSAEPLVGVPVAANDENSSTVAFVSSSRYGNIASSVTSPVMFVAASNSKLGPYRDVVPAISSRSLESGPKLFSIIEKSFTDTARVDIEYHLRDYFIVKYITGFSTRDFVYFATVQRKSHFRALEEWGYISRLSRVCSSDAGYHTYTEMTISCLGPDGTDYNLLQDASVIKTGSILSRSLGIREGQDVLMATFAAARDHSVVPSTRSAVCLFPLTDIERTFLENIQLCYNGSVSSRNMDYIAGSINECPEPSSSSQQKRASLLHNNFCSESIKMNGSAPLISTPVITYENVTLTGITATTTNHHHTIAFVGTSNGSVKKILVSSASTAEEFAEVVVDAGHTILEDVLRDVNGKYIIAASPYKIARIPVDSFLKQDSVVLDKQHPHQQQMRVDHNASLNQEQNQQQHRQQQRPSETTPIVIKKHLEQPIDVRPNPVIPEKQHEQQQSRLQQNSSVIHKHNERQHRHPQKTQGFPSLTTSASSGFHVPDYVLVFIITGCALFLALLFIVFLLHRKEVSVWLYSKYGIRLQARITASSLSSSSSSREEEKLFDCFISYSKLDEAFVTQVLAPKLENESPSFRLCLNYRDLPFASGYLSYAIIEAMEASRRSILVISENFLENEWCRFEFKSAHLEVLRNNPRHKLILVFIGNINAKDIDPDMRYWMKSSTILLWGEKMFWQKLRYAMPDVSVARKSYQDFLNT